MFSLFCPRHRTITSKTWNQERERYLRKAILASTVGEPYVDSRNRSVHSALKIRSKIPVRYANGHIFSGRTRGTLSGSHAPKGYTSARCGSSRLSLTAVSALHLCSADADPNKWHARACVEEYRTRNSPRRCTWTTSRTRPGYRHGRFIRPFLSRARCFIRDGSRVVFSFDRAFVSFRLLPLITPPYFKQRKPRKCNSTNSCSLEPKWPFVCESEKYRYFMVAQPSVKHY